MPRKMKGGNTEHDFWRKARTSGKNVLETATKRHPSPFMPTRKRARYVAPGNRKLGNGYQNHAWYRNLEPNQQNHIDGTAHLAVF